VRVTGGRLGGRVLRPPQGALRPTSDRVREAIFARLGLAGGARVLDLYAGTGALGIEALSRGAARAVFVERAPRCLALLRANLASLGLEAAARVVRGDARRAVRRLGQAGERFDLVLLDPPYDSGEAPLALAALAEAAIVAPEGVLVVETAKRHPLPPVDGLLRLDERRYGDTLVTRLCPDPAPTRRRPPERAGSPSLPERGRRSA
jgi:16S rRNA (guanine(966)-N(2))-methyltransferase RsmD